MLEIFASIMESYFFSELKIDFRSLPLRTLHIFTVVLKVRVVRQMKESESAKGRNLEQYAKLQRFLGF